MSLVCELNDSHRNYLKRFSAYSLKDVTAAELADIELDVYTCFSVCVYIYLIQRSSRQDFFVSWSCVGNFKKPAKNKNKKNMCIFK